MFNEIPLPIIRREHYDAFVAIPTADIPDTFNEWQKRIANTRAEFIQTGATIVDIESILKSSPISVRSVVSLLILSPSSESPWKNTKPSTTRNPHFDLHSNTNGHSESFSAIIVDSLTRKAEC